MKEKILTILNEYYEEYLKRNEELHKLHKERVIKALEWVDEHKIRSKKTIESTRVVVNEVPGKIISFDFRGVPLFMCEIVVSPDCSNGDMGEGCGYQCTLEF